MCVPPVDAALYVTRNDFQDGKTIMCRTAQIIITIIITVQHTRAVVLFLDGYCALHVAYAYR